MAWGLSGLSPATPVQLAASKVLHSAPAHAQGTFLAPVAHALASATFLLKCRCSQRPPGSALTCAQSQPSTYCPSLHNHAHARASLLGLLSLVSPSLPRTEAPGRPCVPVPQ